MRISEVSMKRATAAKNEQHNFHQIIVSIATNSWVGCWVPYMGRSGNQLEQRRKEILKCCNHQQTESISFARQIGDCEVEGTWKTSFCKPSTHIHAACCMIHWYLSIRLLEIFANRYACVTTNRSSSNPTIQLLMSASLSDQRFQSACSIGRSRLPCPCPPWSGRWWPFSSNQH